MINVIAAFLVGMILMGIFLLTLRGLLWLLGWAVALGLVLYGIIRCYLEHRMEKLT